MVYHKINSLIDLKFKQTTKSEDDTMYLVTGLGQPDTRRNAPPKSDEEAPQVPPRRGQRRRGQKKQEQKKSVKPQPSPVPDQISSVTGDLEGKIIMSWSLNVPYRKDFEAFIQEVEKKMGLHYIKEGKGPHWDNTNKNINKNNLKAYHDYALK